jgi:1,4-dihydroxy-6-naphthoate synthase
MNDPKLSLAFSPCPNDTFIFCGLVNGLIGKTDFSPGQIAYEDVETLNKRAFDSIHDVTKLSFYAYGHVRDRYSLLTAGSALGRGCGPILVKANGSAGRNFAGKKIAIPGKFTTAAMLLKLYLPEAQPVETRFERIMPMVVRGEVDAGVIIHESRFTYPRHGLIKVMDLGEWWEDMTGCPLPLGGIAILKTHSEETRTSIEAAIRASIKYAQENLDLCMPYIKKYAQELDDEVIQDHISLYVNSFSEDLGREGEKAVRVFLEKGQKAGLLPCRSNQIF